MNFYCGCAPKNVSNIVKCVDVFFLHDKHYNEIKQMPMTIYFKSRGSRDYRIFQLFFFINIVKSEFLLWLCNQKPFQYRKMRWLFLLTCQTLQWHQTDAPWPFILKVDAAMLNEFFKFLNKNRKKWTFIVAVQPKTFPTT